MAISQTQLESLYLAYFGRPADFDGLVFYTSNPNFDIWSVAAAFSASPESQSLYGTGFSAATINAIYQNLFNRDAEPAGLLYWSTEVASGRLTAAGAAYAIFLGAQNEDLIAVQNKMTVSAAFTAALDTAPEIIGYSGDVAADAARDFLHTVDATAASVTTAIAGLDAAVAAVVAGGSVVIGENFTLTTGVDGLPAFQGGSANDTYIGFIGDATHTTAQPFDVIDGGAGTDELHLTFGGDIESAAFTMSNVENVTISMTQSSAAGNDDPYVDASSWSGVQNVTVNWLDVTDTNTVSVDFLTANLTTLTLQGTGGASTADSSFDFNTTGGVASIQTLTVKDIQGDMTADIGSSTNGITNIPVLVLNNINHDDSGEINIYVTDNVGTGTNDTLTIMATDAGAMNYDTWTSTNVNLFNETGDGVIENLTVVTAGANGSSLDIDGTTSLVNVTVSGTGDLALWLSDSTQVTTYDASALAGDLSSSVSSTGDVTVTLGSGDHWFGYYGTTGTMALTAGAGSTWFSTSPTTTGEFTASLGDGNDWFDQGTAAIFDVDLGAGNDVLFAGAWWGTAMDADSVVAGGAGTDTLIVSSALFTTTNMAGVSGFETLAAYGSGTWDLDNLAGITSLSTGVNQYGYGPDAWWDPKQSADVWNTASGNVSFVDVGSSVTSLNLIDDFANVVFDLKTDGTANALLVNIGTPEGDSDEGDLAGTSLDVGDIEKLTFLSMGDDGDKADADKSATISTNTITTLLAGDATKIVVTGNSYLSLGDISSTGKLTEIDASAFTGNLVLGTAAGSTTGMAFIGGLGKDTYIGTVGGDTVNAGAGLDTITLGAAGAADTLIFESGDSKVGGIDVVTNFTSGEDNIDLGAFAFSGQQASALVNKGDINATIAAWDKDTASITDFFVSAAIQRGVAVSSDGASTYVLVDVNKDGDFSVGTDLVVQLSGTTAVALSDFGF